MAKLYFNYGAMNAGKSTILLQAAYNYDERGMRTVLLKPSLDNRGGTQEKITSRIGLSNNAIVFNQTADLMSLVEEIHSENKIDCVLVDEAQFLSLDQVWQLSSIADQLRIPVMCYGIRTDFRGDLFPGSAALLAVADNLKEIKTLCWCGRKATMNMRFGKDGQAVSDGTQIEVGGNERYISLCRKHWTKKEIAPGD